MAMAIKGCPVLYGESAVRFIEETEKFNELPAPSLSKEQQDILNKFLKTSQDFKLQDKNVI